MSLVPADLRFTREHEWVRILPDGTAVAGITDYAQQSLGDIVFVELPKPAKRFAAGATFGVIESVKAASDLFMPIASEVVDVNPRLATEPELVNQDPYGEGWMIKIRPDDAKAVSALLDPAAYQALI